MNTSKKIFNIRSAYGQLILLIFMPIFLLSVVGSVLVYMETMKANHHEQKALAKAILIRYQPVIQAQLPLILAKKTDQSEHKLQDLLFSVQTESELIGIAIINHDGSVLESVGFKAKESWQFINPSQMSADRQKSKKNQHIIDKATKSGTAYGVSFGKLGVDDNTQPLWLFVNMDNQPLKLAQYRIAFALMVTALFILLLLLLSLNIYSRRWIEPIYQLRLFLQSLDINHLTKPLKINAQGELYELKKDLTDTLKKISNSVQELKTHTEQTEEDLQQAFDAMEMQNISIRTARDEAVSTSEAKSAFLANISHELRTPLNSIDGFINLLARHGKLSSEQDLYVHTIRKSSAHLLALVNDVLDFSKIEAGKLVLDSHEFDLYDTIYDVVDMLSPLASEKGLRLAVLFYNDVPLTVVGDALRMKQVLTNLVANAIKFTDSGSILVKVSLDDTQDNHLLISVQDTGMGIGEQDKKQLFRTFSQVDPSITRQYGGTGLGLVISKQLTLLMGGNIGYYDNATENIAKTGSTFWFVVPTHVDVLEIKTASDIGLPILIENSQPPKKPLKILTWINHPDSVQVLKASLAPLPIEIIETHSVVSMLEILKAQSNQWDWVIVDSDTNSRPATDDNMTALLKQLRLYYQGKLAVYGYQIALDNRLLKRYKAYPLHEPIDKRQLYQMLDKRKKSSHLSPTHVEKWQGYRVLAVDDHLPNLLVLDALLAEQGIEVMTANNGFDAIEIISKQVSDSTEKRFDLIFMDIQMPRMSGYQASEQIRKIDQHEPRIPIIALTAHGLSNERDRLIQSGIDDYMSKPISQPQLLQILQKWLGRIVMTDSHNEQLVQAHQSDRYGRANPDKVEIQPMTAWSAIHKNQVFFESFAVVDWEDAVTRAGNNQELASKLLTMMISSITEEKQTLMEAWEEQDHVKVSQITHRLLGASLYTGVPQLRQASEVLDNNCLTYSDIKKLTPSYQAVLQAMDNLLELDFSVWLPLHYHKLDEDKMTWKMI